eukprot:TRINITY_DN70439_c0_g1_i1.p1 TRINITY_DN70439_c0_g1~~TRINITY_DN70439_c0_g1_i1.p1  ORF type:complete len:393 (+),score=90.74 TRINITY_DN70439_c0_g1_i1:97-1179(+)
MTTVRIQGLPKGCNAAAVAAVCQPFGTVLGTPTYHGPYADVEFSTREEAEAAIRALHMTQPWPACKAPVHAVHPKGQGLKRKAAAPHPAAPAAQVPRTVPRSDNSLPPGTPCEGRFEGEWSKCTIVRRNPDGTYCIDWDDGSHSPEIDVLDLRRLDGGEVPGAAEEGEAGEAAYDAPLPAGALFDKSKPAKTALGECLSRMGSNLQNGLVVELVPHGMPAIPPKFKYKAYLTAHASHPAFSSVHPQKKAAEKDALVALMDWCEEQRAADPTWVPVSAECYAQHMASKERRREQAAYAYKGKGMTVKGGKGKYGGWGKGGWGGGYHSAGRGGWQPGGRGGHGQDFVGLPDMQMPPGMFCPS